MKPVQLLLVLLTAILFAAKVVFDKPLTWLQVASPILIYILAILTLYLFAVGIVWGAEKVLQWTETPEETRQRHTMENAQQALKAFAKRHGGE